MLLQGKLNRPSRGPHMLLGELNGLPIDVLSMNAHILIVDDDTRVTSALRRTFAYEGYQVSVAADGEGALSIARTKPPDMVILDLMS